MGDYVLMKKELLLLTLSTSLFATGDLTWIDNQVKAIKSPRSGLSNSELARTHSPFIYKVEVTTPSGDIIKKDVNGTKKVVFEPLKVTAIMNNSALINKKWYRPKDKVRGYVVRSVNSDGVTLANRKHQLRLKIVSTNPKIKIKTK